MSDLQYRHTIFKQAHSMSIHHSTNFNRFYHYLYIYSYQMASSASKSPSPKKGRKSASNQKRKGSNRSPSSSSHSSHSSRSNHSHRKSRSRDDKPKDHGRYPPRRESQKIPQGCKLFVTNIDSKFSQEQLDRDLHAIFDPFGTVKEVIIKTKQGSSNSYVFIEYQDVDSAVRAQSQLKGTEFKGKELKVEFGRGQRKNEDRKSDKCYICHKQGHFAKDCRYNRFTSSRDSRQENRVERDRGTRDRDDRDHRHRKRNSRSRSSSESSHYRRRHSDRDREDYRRRDNHRSPEKRSDYYSRRH